jgi:hypothetical protein
MCNSEKVIAQIGMFMNESSTDVSHTMKSLMIVLMKTGFAFCPLSHFGMLVCTTHCNSKKHCILPVLQFYL